MELKKTDGKKKIRRKKNTFKRRLFATWGDEVFIVVSHLAPFALHFAAIRHGRNGCCYRHRNSRFTRNGWWSGWARWPLTTSVSIDFFVRTFAIPIVSLRAVASVVGRSATAGPTARSGAATSVAARAAATAGIRALHLLLPVAATVTTTVATIVITLVVVVVVMAERSVVVVASVVVIVVVVVGGGVVAAVTLCMVTTSVIPH